MKMTQKMDQHDASLSLLDDDALFCEEENFEVGDDEEDEEEGKLNNYNSSIDNGSVGDLLYEDEELESLFLKETEQRNRKSHGSEASVSVARREAVEWVVKVSARFGFAALTAILAVDYVDRFLSSVRFERDRPWMIQLVAVTCLSLAAKVEETQVPLLLDLQVEDTRFVFEARTIQRMEILILSTLQWKMHPVTPISFLDHIVRRLGLKTNRHWEFLRRCERLLLSAVSDPRFVSYLPSVVATATMMHVIGEVEPRNAGEYRSQLLGVLKTSEETANRCYELISEISEADFTDHRKRKSCEQMPRSPIGVIDASFGSDSSSASKKQRCLGLGSVNSVFVDFVGSPR